MRTRDFWIGGFIGVLIGFFTQLIIGNIRAETIVTERFGVIAGPAILIPAGLWVSSVLGRRFPIFWRFGKFVAVGLLNTSIDFGILNFLSHISATYAGLRVGGYNVVSVGTALVNSYFWNKFWVFEKRKSESRDEFIRFLGVSLSGLVVNSGIVYFLTTFVPPIGGFSPATWELAAKIPAIGVSLFWNFIGYKLLVFKTKERRQSTVRG